MFTEVMTLHRRIEIERHSPTIRIRDTVINDGFQAVPHRLLYHVNLGYPLLDEAARLSGEAWDLSSLLMASGERREYRLDIQVGADG